MATRSAIAIKKGDKITCITCHWDGYPTGGVGETLLNHYKDEATIDKLMSLGDLSSLGELPEVNKNYWNDSGIESKGCGTYRDRGEDNVDAVTTDEDKFYHDMSGIDAEYFYLFENGKWKVACSDTDFKFVDLQDYIKGLVRED